MRAGLNNLSHITANYNNVNNNIQHQLCISRTRSFISTKTMRKISINSMLETYHWNLATTTTEYNQTFHISSDVFVLCVHLSPEQFVFLRGAQYARTTNKYIYISHLVSFWNNILMASIYAWKWKLLTFVEFRWIGILINGIHLEITQREMCLLLICSTIVA